MSQIKKNFDVVNQGAPAAESGTNFFDNPQIQPGKGGEDPGWNATNSTEPHTNSGGVPPGKKGGGY